ncbi:hypothetical protein MTO96_027988 [Rhipicephalus appendiculatus]
MFGGGERDIFASVYSVCARAVTCAFSGTCEHPLSFGWVRGILAAAEITAHVLRCTQYAVRTEIIIGVSGPPKTLRRTNWFGGTLVYVTAHPEKNKRA